MLVYTDKIEPHGYYQTYLRLAAQIGPSGKICELGVHRGASLMLWQVLFPLGTVTGVDNEKGSQWPIGARKVVAEQDDPYLPQTLNETYDLIIDDASHAGPKTRKSFELLWPLVNPDGFYVVEDWHVAFPLGSSNWGPGMLRTAESFLQLLDRRDAECDSIEYRYGMVIIHRRK